MVKVKPLRDMVIVELKRTTKTASGIILAEGAQEVEKTATVIAVGPDVEDVKVGDRVLFDVYSGFVIHEEPNLIHTLVTEDDIKGIIEG